MRVAYFAEPKFADGIKSLRITINDAVFFEHFSFLERNGLDLNKAPLNIPARLYLEDRKPYFDGKIRAATKTVEIKRNKIVNLPSRWDENANDRAYEVINEKGRVVFQLVLEAADHVEIDAGQYINNDSTWRTAVFKYPASQYPGELDPSTRLKPLSVKTLYQFFVTDCKGHSERTAQVLGKQSGNKFKVERIICSDLDTRALYLAVFVPHPDPEPVISALASEFQGIIDEWDRVGLGAAHVRMQPGEREERGDNLVFTRLVIIYHEHDLFEHQIKSLTEEFEKRGAYPRFLGPQLEVARNSLLNQQS